MKNPGQTTTVSKDRRFWLCACCAAHGGEDRLLDEPPATCSTCELPCSCEGCHAEATE